MQTRRLLDEEVEEVIRDFSWKMSSTEEGRVVGVFHTNQPLFINMGVSLGLVGVHHFWRGTPPPYEYTGVEKYGVRMKY